MSKTLRENRAFVKMANVIDSISLTGYLLFSYKELSKPFYY